MEAGDRIGPYNLIKRLGKGNFEVWRAIRAGSAEEVAIKIIEPEEEDFVSLLNGFLKEVHTWSAAGGHDNVHSLRSPEVHDGKLLLVSACADQPLSRWLRDNGGKAPSVESAVRMMCDILAGLEHLHTRQPTILHLDLKPANVLLFDGTARIADFGLSRAIEGSRHRSRMGMGTEGYNAPETYHGEYLVRSDIWSAGVMLYEMLMGHLPFPQRGPALMGAILNGSPLPLADTLPPNVRDVITRCLEKDPNIRISSARAMHEALLVSLSQPKGKRNASIAVMQDTLVASLAQSEAKQSASIVVRKLREVVGRWRSFQAFAYSPSGKWIVTGSLDATAKAWDAQTGQELRTLKGHKDAVTSIAFSMDGKWIVTGSSDGTTKAWDATFGTALFTITVGFQPIAHVAFSKDGRLLATAGEDGIVSIYEVEAE